MDGYGALKGRVRGLPDKRLLARLGSMVDCFSQRPDSSIPEASEGRNDMDAAYDFFKNPRVSPAGVAAASLPFTLDNLRGALRVLCLQDTTDLNFAGLEGCEGLGYTDGHDTRGLKLHSTLAVTPDGLAAGLLTQQVWTRPFELKGKAASRRSRDAQDKESFRWQDHAQAARACLPAGVTVVHVADREADVYDWFAAERPAFAHLLVRVAQPHRLVVHGPDGAQGKLADAAQAQPVLGKHVITVPRADDRPSRQAELTLRAGGVELLPPKHAKQRSRLRPVPVWVVEAREEAAPAGAEAVHWRLVTTEPIRTWEEALRALREYVLRWLIERFHFVLKSGFRVERLQLETAGRLANAAAVYSQAAVRLMRLAYLARVAPEAPAGEEFDPDELDVLQRERDRRAKRALGPIRTIAEAVRAVAQVGGHLGRKGDGHPGVLVLWRGLKSLHHLVLGFRHGLSAPRPSLTWP